MLDTLTLLVVAVIQFEIIGVVLLTTWFISRRARGALGGGGAVALVAALCLLPAWYVWDAGIAQIAGFHWILLALIVLVPTGLLLFLALHLVRSEAILRAVRITRSGQSVLGLSQVADSEALEEDLRQAMQESGQLYVHYQPIYSAGTRSLVGFEALLRWNHPHRGLVAPMQFIPLAEQTELIVPLGAWVLETACAEAASWPEPWYLSVNLSPVQLEKIHLVRDVRNVLERTGLAAERLELEITEGVLVAAEGGEISRLAELRRAGVRIAIDDFGTGYSSLGYLRQLPFDTIKIDRSFVRNLESDSSAQAIVGTIVELSRRLEREIVAEGVETEGQYAILNALQCHRVQGWLLGKPMPPEEIAVHYFPSPAEKAEGRDLPWVDNAGAE
ncbi:putative bifunctional diguanylate cyclase/phosphodiesterase [Bordetella flabilis]|uniref:putative bifunctional diguanylate cyclase/phosphodiesterase n=1 Tax=Bordetella flabilis TaxID=463014 RepID=UPI000A024516|nr:EAL domain-containing protein [Bordetella flabilis]